MNRDEVIAFVHERMNEVREGLDLIEGAILESPKPPNWRETLADITDEFHIAVHRVIGLFDLSSTPAQELAAEIPEEDEARWRLYDEELSQWLAFDQGSEGALNE
jgi:hypothetical protein